MGQFRVVQTENEPIRRAFLDGFLKVNSVDENKNYKVSLMLLNSKRNRNGWVYENIETNLSQFVDIPILCAFVDGKAQGHDFELKRDPETGAEYASFIGAKSEHIIGWIGKTAPNGELNAYMQNIDGTDWVCIHEALLPLFYNKELIDEMNNNGGKMRVSIETLVSKNRVEDDTEYEEVWTVVGVTVISRTEAVAGANIKHKVNAYWDELREVKMRAAQFYADLNKEPQTQTQNNSKGETTMAEDKKAVEELAANSVDEPAVGEVETIESVKALLNAANTALEIVTAENATLKEQIKSLQEAALERKKNDVRSAITALVNERVSNFSDRLDAHICDDLLTDEQIGCYASKEDGVEIAKRDVDARCMAKLAELETAKLNAQQKHFAWSVPTTGAADEPEDGIASLVAKYGK